MVAIYIFYVFVGGFIFLFLSSLFFVVVFFNCFGFHWGYFFLFFFGFFGSMGVKCVNLATE